MHVHPFPRIALTAALAALLAGCGGSSSTAPAPLTQQQANEVAQQVSALLFITPDVTSVPTSASSPQSRADDAGMNMHRRGVTGPLRVRAEGDLAWTFEVHWYDVAGAEQEAYDSTTTARVTTAQTAHGSYAGEGYEATLAHAGQLDLAGLLASQNEIVVSAARADTLNATYAGPNATAQLELRCAGAFAQVRRSKPLEQNPYPSSGTASWWIDAHRAVQSGQGSQVQDYEAAVVVTYNGTRYVPMVVNGQWHYTLDLDTGAVTPAAV